MEKKFEFANERDGKLWRAICAVFKKNPLDKKAYLDCFDLIRNVSESEKGDNAKRYGWKRLDLSAALKAYLRDGNKAAREKGDNAFRQMAYELNRRILCWEGTDNLDSFILYMEANRLFEKQFYLPRRKQLAPVVQALQDLAERKINLLAVSLPPGVGKALADDTPVLTKDGWKEHGDLVVGDEVIGLDGQFKKVVAVHPKCMLDCLVEFTNGEKIQCHENHEWMVFNRHRNRYETLETKEIERSVIETGEPNTRGHRYMYLLPPHAPVVGEKADLPLDPYTFGVWLGDGTNCTPLISEPAADYPIVQRIVENGSPVTRQFEHKTTHVMYYGFGFRKSLQQMGMCHSRKTTTKHIPVYYLTASVEQRLQLLAGLLDTDGTLRGNKYIFSTTEAVLARNVLDLIATFGWRACVNLDQPKVSTSGVHGGKPVYCISFTPDIKIPCALERKQNKKPPKQRRIAIQSIQRVEPKQGNCISVEGDGMYLAGRSMLPTHNTTLAMFFLCWLAGRDPEKPMLTGSHNKDFLAGVYGELLRMLDPEGEYLWFNVFPELKVIGTNAKTLMIDIGEDVKAGKRFATLEFTSVGSGNAGKVRAENLLYCDDLVDGLETALSKERLDKLWGLYTTDLRQRKIGDCPELHIATRWSVHDVIGRLEDLYGQSGTARFIVIPALNENDESNFDYPIEAGFTTEFYKEQRSVMDDASWDALYQNTPIEREGQLYHKEQLRRYFELPDGTPDAIISVCDTKDRGTDYCVLPIAYVYGQDYYMEDFVCDNSAPDVVETRLVMKLLKHSVQTARFESNSAGGKVAESVQKAVKEKGGRTKIETKWTTANKETKIIVSSPWVKEHCLFKDDSVIKDDKEYRLTLRLLTAYSMAGKNKHDDVPDAMAQLAEYAESFSTAQAEVIRNPFRRYA